MPASSSHNRPITGLPPVAGISPSTPKIMPASIMAAMYATPTTTPRQRVPRILWIDLISVSSIARGKSEFAHLCQRLLMPFRNA